MGLCLGCHQGSASVIEIHGKTLTAWSAALNDANFKHRQKAVRSLGNAGAVDDRILPLLIEALKDRVALVRLEAVEAIEKMGQAGNEALPALKMLLKDPDPKVRDQAIKAAKQLEGI